MKILERDNDPFLRPGFLQHVALDRPREPLLSLLNTKFVLSQKGIYQLPNYYPRAWISYGHEVIGDASDRVARLREGSFSKDVVLLEEEPTQQVNSSLNKESSIRFIDYQPNTIDLRIDTAENAFLTLSEVNFPGWVATINGRSTPILTSYHILRTIEVPKGRHKITFKYRPNSFIATF